MAVSRFCVEATEGYSPRRTSTSGAEATPPPTRTDFPVANPEPETYGYLATTVTTKSEQLHGFVGPARSVGIVTGEAEKDSVAYLPLVAVRENGQWSIELVER